MELGVEGRASGVSKGLIVEQVGEENKYKDEHLVVGPP